jgi:hypothetical protein
VVVVAHQAIGQHLVLQTRGANLSRLMRHVNGVYTQRFNRRHGLVGHLLQGRFKAILVDRDAYLLALCRYVERNPVAAGIVRSAAEWRWSSAQAHLLQVPTPHWLDSEGLHGYLLGRPARGDADRARAASVYAAMLDEAADPSLWQHALRQQVFLGDEDFVRRMLEQAGAATPVSQVANARVRDAGGVPLLQRRMPARLPEPPRRGRNDRGACGATARSPRGGRLHDDRTGSALRPVFVEGESADCEGGCEGQDLTTAASPAAS